MTEKRYLISDASKKIEVEAHVLRYWEEELALDIPRNELGHRYYREEDIELLMSVKFLKDKGFQLKAIRMLLPDVNQIAELENEKLFDLRDKLDALFGIHVESEETLHTTNKVTDNTAEGENLTYSEQTAPKEIKDNKKVIDVTGVISMENAQITDAKEENDIDKETEDKLQEFRLIMSSIMSDAVKKNNSSLIRELNQTVSESVRKEVDYLLHLKEEREEERFKKLDRTIREYQLSRQQVAASTEFEKKKKKSKFFKKNNVRI